MDLFCEVIVDVINKQVNRTFDYAIPLAMQEYLEVGYRVKVPFGRRIVTGFIVKIKAETSFDPSKVKPIMEVIDLFKPLNEEFIDLAYQMAKHNFTFYATCLQTMIPGALKAKYHKKLVIHNFLALSEEFREFCGKQKTIVLNKNVEPYLKEIKGLLRTKALTLEEEMSVGAKHKIKKMVEIVDHQAIATSRKGAELLEYLQEVAEPIEKSVLINDMGFSNQVISTLEKNGILGVYAEEIYRDIAITEIEDKKVILNEEQEDVIAKVLDRKEESHTFVLKGVTGSGKTEVYMQIIEDCLKRGKDAILLVPEIALTPQMTSRFRARFLDKVAVMHSGLSTLEKYDEWRKILNHDANIVVGARSAIFAPFDSLGVIIIDEAHEESYIQDSNPRYDAVEIAKIRSKTHDCPLILGSATPKVSEYFKALNGEQTLLLMKQRANQLDLPESQIVSMVDELKQGNRTVFSKVLQEKIKENLQNHYQSILFLNRRGFSSFVMCRSCGETVTCPHCDLSLTYHKIGNTLKCHHCGYKESMVKECPACHSKLIKSVGNGTQKIEEEFLRLYPSARVIRMDHDTMRTARDYEVAFQKFKNKEADVLIGTQMIAKGLDFEDVTLVGVLNADLALKYPIYDSNEICYNLIEQVSGRAGRGNKKGQVIIQTYNPTHYAVLAAAKHDYDYFYDREIENRLLCKNPPFSNLVQVYIASKEIENSKEQAYLIRRNLDKQRSKSEVLGPAEAPIFKENDYYTYVISIKIEDEKMEDALVMINNLYQDDKHCHVRIKRM